MIIICFHATHRAGLEIWCRPVVAQTSLSHARASRQRARCPAGKEQLQFFFYLQTCASLHMNSNLVFVFGLLFSTFKSFVMKLYFNLYLRFVSRNVCLYLMYF